MRSLYRKYRPLKLAEVVGQPQVTEALARAIKTGNFAHAYLFTGPRGTGKTSVARIFAHEINGFPYTTEDSYVDIIEIDAASNNGVDNIRELSERAAIAPSEGKFKVYIIDEVHMLSRAAFNALLKTLEEPPAHVVFVMATTDAYKVPVTISSRAQTFTFKLASPETLVGHLRHIADTEKMQIDDEALALVAEQGGGSFRDALSILDQVKTLSDGKKVTLAGLTKSLGLPPKEQLRKILDAYVAGNLNQVKGVLSELLETGVKPETVAEKLAGEIVAKPTAANLSLLARLPSVTAPFAEAKLLVACAPEVVRPQVVAPADATVPPSEVVSSSVTGPTPGKAVTPAGPAPVVASPPTSPAGFNWGEFVESFRAEHAGIFSQLKNSEFEVRDGILRILPKRSIAKRILEQKNNLPFLGTEAKRWGLGVEVGEAGSSGNTSPAGIPAENSPVEKVGGRIAEISAIMGGEVVEVSESGDPFEAGGSN